jgi:predicted TIM-barrel fold metal-dependent hydrolase
LAQNKSVTVDADGHVLEPPDLWKNYLEAEYVDRAIRIEHDKNGLEVLLFDDQPAEGREGILGAFGGIGMDAATLLTPGTTTYLEGAAFGASNPQDRLSVMDDEAIDIALFYPTIGISWEGSVTDSQLATAYTRAYNRWLVDFCSANTSRLKPVAHINLLDPEAACQEARRARADGCVGVMLSPDPIARGGRVLDHPELLPFWSTLQDLDMPVAFHVVVRPDSQKMIANWLSTTNAISSRDPRFRVMNFAFLAIDVMAAFTQMISLGIFEKYPRLKCVVLEAGATWIAAWLDRMDAKYQTLKDDVSPLKMPPSECFYRQCLVSADPDETMLAACVDHIGADYFVWASDYPHIDASFGVVSEIRGRLSTLSAEDQAKVLGNNAVRFYRL